jgi:hypothetical protein
MRGQHQANSRFLRGNIYELDSKRLRSQERKYKIGRLLYNNPPEIISQNQFYLLYES